MPQTLKIVYCSNYNGVNIIDVVTNKEVETDDVDKLCAIIGAYATSDCDDEEGGLFVGNMLALKDFALTTAQQMFPDQEFTFEEDNASS